VLNTAADCLPEMAKTVRLLMLVAEECRRAAAPTFSRVLNTRADFRMGLSATPDREQKVGLSLGNVVFTFSLRVARVAG